MRLIALCGTACQLLLVFILSGAASAGVGTCPEPMAHKEWYSTVQAGRHSFQLPWGLSITRFHTAIENETGQRYDELRLNGEPSKELPSMVFLRTFTSYSVEDNFAWQLLRRIGEPVSKEKCIFKGDTLMTYVYEDRTMNRSVYEGHDIQIVVYGETSLQHLVMIIESKREVW